MSYEKNIWQVKFFKKLTKCYKIKKKRCYKKNTKKIQLYFDRYNFKGSSRLFSDSVLNFFSSFGSSFLNLTFYYFFPIESFELSFFKLLTRILF